MPGGQEEVHAHRCLWGDLWVCWRQLRLGVDVLVVDEFASSEAKQTFCHFWKGFHLELRDIFIPCFPFHFSMFFFFSKCFFFSKRLTGRFWFSTSWLMFISDFNLTNSQVLVLGDAMPVSLQRCDALLGQACHPLSAVPRRHRLPAGAARFGEDSNDMFFFFFFFFIFFIAPFLFHFLLCSWKIHIPRKFQEVNSVDCLEWSL